MFGEAFSGKEFSGNWGFVEYVTVPAGSAIPVHTHDQDEEVYFIFEGEGILTLDGQEVQVGVGDLATCRLGSSHGLRNTSDREIKLIVVGIPA
jgi:mannose-6-phosphate isomerase-like protein (cupin superfamily)